MPSLKSLRKRISSVRNTQQITKAMKMVSAAKLRRAQEAAVAARPFARKLSEMLASVAAGMPPEAHPLLRAAEDVRKLHVLLITADRGLCGAYNSNLIRQTEALLREHRDRDVSLSIVGRKGVEAFKRRHVAIIDRWVQTGGASVELARQIGSNLTARFATGEADRIVIVYSAFRSALSQVPTVETLLPVTPQELSGESRASEYVVEPDAPTLLARLLPQYVQVRVYGSLLEAVASEHGARMTAMDSATNNASDLIFRLVLQMNRARQAAITKELMEIVSGAEALKG